MKQNAATLTPIVDPSGLDQLLLSLTKAACTFAERKYQEKTGKKVDWWGGENGVASVAKELVTQYQIPNKRFHDIVTPRAVAEKLEIVRPPKRRLKK
jgi:hypothetical protein